MASNSINRVAIYARVSTKDKGQEVENQLRQLRGFAEQQGWTISREYIDHETAKTDDRAISTDILHFPARVSVNEAARVCCRTQL